MDDDYYAGLCDVMTQALHEATRQRNECRRENVQLRKIIANTPSLVTELQDRVTLLESHIQRLGMPDG